MRDLMVQAAIIGRNTSTSLTLNAIIGMTELSMDTDLNSEQSQFLEVIQSSSTVLLRVINDILDFSKIEAGQLELETADIDLRKLVESVAEILNGRARVKNLEVFSYVDPSLPHTCLGDSTRLGQILVNLVGNALKFTEEGEVSIKVEAGQVDLNADHRSVELHFMVSDTGIGISEEVFKEIPINALTARQGEAEIRKCIDAGCTDFVGKPIQRQLLIDMIIPYLEATTVSEPVRQV